MEETQVMDVLFWVWIAGLCIGIAYCTFRIRREKQARALLVLNWELRQQKKR